MAESENGQVIMMLPFSRCQTMEWGSLPSDELIVCLMRNMLANGRAITPRLCLWGDGYATEIKFPKLEYQYVGTTPKMKQRHKGVYVFEFVPPCIVFPCWVPDREPGSMFLPDVLVCVEEADIKRAEDMVNKEWRKRAAEAEWQDLHVYMQKLLASSFAEDHLRARQIVYSVDRGVGDRYTPFAYPNGCYSLLCSLPRKEGSALWKVLQLETMEERRAALDGRLEEPESVELVAK